MIFGGDIMLSRNVGKYIENSADGDYRFPFEDIASVTATADIAFANLECSISSRGEALEGKRYVFRADPDAMKGLVHGGFDVLSLANNHILDYGAEALADTEALLTKDNIGVIGLYDGAAANGNGGYHIIEVKGRRIGFIGYMGLVPRVYPRDFEAFARRPIPATDEELIKDIMALKGQCDLVIASFHWGIEYHSDFEKEQAHLAHVAIDAGAHIVAGHHPHYVQPVEKYKGGLIFYSLGNLIFDQWSRPSSRDSNMIRVIVGEDLKLDYEIVPIWLNSQWQPVLRHDHEDALELVTRVYADHGKINGYESVESRTGMQYLNAVNKRLNIKHTLLFGREPKYFNPASKNAPQKYIYPNNEFILSEAKRAPGMYSAVALVHPEDPQALERIHQYQSHGAVGIHLTGDMFSRNMDDAYYTGFFNALMQHKLPLGIAEVKTPGWLDKLAALMDAYPELGVVLQTSFGTREKIAEVAQVLAGYPNLSIALCSGDLKERVVEFTLRDKNRNALQKLIQDNDDRFLFASNVGARDIWWSTEDNLFRSVRDYMGQLEEESYPFTFTGSTLKGLGLTTPALDKLYRENCSAIYNLEL